MYTYVKSLIPELLSDTFRKNYLEKKIQVLFCLSLSVGDNDFS